MNLIDAMDRRWYPGYSRNWDDQLFRQRILAFIGPQSLVLDLGAGAGIIPHMNFRGLVGKMCGVDPDARVIRNPFLDEGRQGIGEAIPYPDSTFDVVFAGNVLEHLVCPERVFREVSRVLKPGGVFMVKTPNRGHYVPLIARLTPHWFHQWINRIRGRAVADTFRTAYRANSPGTLERLAHHARLQVDDISLIEGRPEYARIAAPLYLFGLAYERSVNACACLARFRVLMIATIRKPA